MPLNLHPFRARYIGVVIMETVVLAESAEDILDDGLFPDVY